MTESYSNFIPPKQTNIFIWAHEEKKTDASMQYLGHACASHALTNYKIPSKLSNPSKQISRVGSLQNLLKISFVYICSIFFFVSWKKKRSHTSRKGLEYKLEQYFPVLKGIFAAILDFLKTYSLAKTK